MTLPNPMEHLTRQGRNLSAEVTDAIQEAYRAHSAVPNVTLPPGELKGVEVIHYTLDAGRCLAEAYGHVMRGFPELVALPDVQFTGLRIDGVTYMSDTPLEKLTNLPFIEAARGDVLIFGLGIGLILEPILAKPEVRSVTVVEKNFWVRELVAHHYLKRHEGRLLVHLGDAFTYQPGEYADLLGNGGTFDTVYFDIWPDIGDQNLPDMERLMNRARPWLRPGGWLDCWMREKAEWMRDVMAYIEQENQKGNPTHVPYL